MLSIGQVLQERYRVDGVLGMGGMGGVYLAHHLLLDSDVAIKEVSLEQVAPSFREAALRLFRAEAQIFHRLHHANLPRFYDFFEFEGQPYMVMERVMGKTLDQVLMDRLWPEDQITEWASQLCNVLGYLHGQAPPVIFRDLKPANVIITPEGAIKLIDFGISKSIEMDGGTATMARGVGSRGFAPLEQYGGGTDARTDIYALGATLYNVATQQVPPESTQLAVGAATLRNVRDLRPEITGRLSYAIHGMMKLRSEDRPSSIRQVQNLLAGHEVAEAPSSLFRPRKAAHPPRVAPPEDTTPPWGSVTPGGPAASPFSVVPPDAPASPAPASHAASSSAASLPAARPGAEEDPVSGAGSSAGEHLQSLPTRALGGPSFPPAVSFGADGVSAAPLHQQPTQALGGPSFPSAVSLVSGAVLPPGPAPSPSPGGLPDWRTLAAPAPPGLGSSGAPSQVKKIPLTPRTIAAGVAILVVLIGAAYSLLPSSKGSVTTSTARLVVTTRPAGASVKVDGVDRGVSPVTVDNLRQGSTAVVHVELDGYANSGGSVPLKEAENSQEYPLKAFPGRASFSVTPAQAKVFVDGKALAERANYVELSPGRHTIEFALDGYHSDTRTIEAADGHRENWKIDLKPQMSLLKLGGLAGVDVKVDGASWGAAASRERPIQVGRHSLEANTGLGLRSVTVDVKNQPVNAFALETTLFVERQLKAQAPRSGNVMLVRSEASRDLPAQSWQFTAADSIFSMSSYSVRYVNVDVQSPDGRSCHVRFTAPAMDTSLQTGRTYAAGGQGMDRTYAEMSFYGTGLSSRRRHSYYSGSGSACFTIHRAFADARARVTSVEASFATFDSLGRGQYYGYVRCSQPQER